MHLSFAHLDVVTEGEHQFWLLPVEHDKYRFWISVICEKQINIVKRHFNIFWKLTSFNSEIHARCTPIDLRQPPTFRTTQFRHKSINNAAQSSSGKVIWHRAKENLSNDLLTNLGRLDTYWTQTKPWPNFFPPVALIRFQICFQVTTEEPNFNALQSHLVAQAISTWPRWKRFVTVGTGKNPSSSFYLQSTQHVDNKRRHIDRVSSVLNWLFHLFHQRPQERGNKLLDSSCWLC
jgi:hypothetical protein